MKIQNLLSVILLSILTISCSTDESVMNDIDKEIQNNADAYAYFSFDLNASGVATKAATATDESTTDPNEKENRVNNCYLAVFNADNDNLLTSHFYKGGEEGDILPGKDNLTLLNTHITFKVSGNKPNLRFVAITNLNYNLDPDYSDIISLPTLQNCKTYSALMAAMIKENPTVLVKVGEQTLNASDYGTSTSLNTNKPNNVIIPVSQRAAAIELESFVVRKRNGDVLTGLNVENVKVQLENLNMITTVKEGFVSSFNEVGTIESWKAGETEASRLYTYANSNQENKTTLKISYTLDGLQKTASYTIKTPANGGYTEEVKANTLYKLNVTITNEVVDVTVNCYTNDWQEGGDYEVVVKPSTNNQ